MVTASVDYGDFNNDGRLDIAVWPGLDGQLPAPPC